MAAALGPLAAALGPESVLTNLTLNNANLVMYKIDRRGGLGGPGDPNIVH